MKSVGWIIWKGDGPYEAQKGKPFRLYAKQSTALKTALDWGWPDLSVREVFVPALATGGRSPETRSRLSPEGRQSGGEAVTPKE